MMSGMKLFQVVASKNFGYKFSRDQVLCLEVEKIAKSKCGVTKKMLGILHFCYKE